MPARIKRFQLLLNDTVVTDPANWPSFVPTTARHSIYRTLISEFTENRVVLVKDAKKLVDDAYDIDGVATVVSVSWREWDSILGEYSDNYSLGKLSFKPSHYKRSKNKSEVGFEPVGFITDFLARDETVVNLQELKDIGGGDITEFVDETKTFSLENYLIREFAGFRDRGFSQFQETLESGDSAFMGINYDKLADQGDPRISGNMDVEILYFDYDIPVLFENNVVFKENGDVKMSLNLDFDYLIDFTGNNANLTVSVFYQKNEETPVVINDFEFITANANGGSALLGSLNIDETISLDGIKENDSIKIYGSIKLNFGFDIVASMYLDWITTPQTIVFTQDKSFPSTTIKGMLPWEYLLRLCQKVTGRNDCLRSEYFGRTDGEVYSYGSDGEGSMLFISNVYQLRGYPLSEYPLQDSLMNAFKELDNLKLLGLGITYESGIPYIKIEKLEDFYDADTLVMTLNADKDGISFEPSINHIWGNVKAGFRNFEEKETGTLGTTHSRRSYTVAGLDQVISKEYNTESEWITSPHLIELLRRKRYDANATKDDDSNKKTIVIEVERDGDDFVKLGVDGFTTITGQDNQATIFNMNLTPARSIINHAPLILSGLGQKIKNDSDLADFLRFQSGQANTTPTTKKTGESIAIPEGAEITRTMLSSELKTPLFNSNFVGNMNTKLTKAQRALFRDGFSGVIKAVDSTGEYYGFVEAKKEKDLKDAVTEITFIKSDIIPS